MLDGRFVDPRRGQDIDGVVAARLTEQPLGHGQLEGRDGRAGQIVGGAEFDDPAEGERLRWSGQEHPDVVADLEVVFLRRSGVHHHVVR